MNKILDLVNLNTILQGWDIKDLPNKNQLRSKLVSRGTVKLFVPVTVTNIIMYYEIPLRGNVTVCDLTHLIYNFYNKEKVTPNDLIFVSTSPQMSYFSNTHLLQHSRDSRYLKKLRFIDFIPSHTKFDIIQHVSNNNYILSVKN